MHLSPSDLADRCFRVFCRWVILGGWVKKKIGVQTYGKPNLVFFSFSVVGGGGQKIKVVQNVLKHALILEFLKSNEFVFWGGGAKNESSSDWSETCSRFGIFEI